MGNQTPFGPNELSKPAVTGAAFIAFLHEEKKRKCSTPPPFLQAMYDGNLTQEDLIMWVKDLYPYWSEALVYSVGAIYIKTNDEPLRTQMLRRMVDVEGKDVVEDLTGWNTPSYEELWLQFGELLGVDRSEIFQWNQFTRTYFSMRTLMTYSRYWDWSWLDGIATWYAADLYWIDQFTKIQNALNNNYKIPNQLQLFINVLLEDAQSHIHWEEEGLRYWACTTERQLSASRAFRERLDIEYQLLVALDEARGSGSLPFQVPTANSYSLD